MARKVRVVTVAQLGRGGPAVADNRAWMGKILAQAAAEQPDIVCLPETFLEQGVHLTALSDVAETVPGPTVDLAADWARAHSCYVICPLTVQRGERFTNDAILIDRQGQIAGAYSKIHPVVEGSAFTSLEKGITPGSDAPVFETDFGRIGLQICFDINWPDTWAALKAQGAEIVFWSSAYDGGKHLSMHAWTHNYYVVSAVKSRHARVIDILGEVLAITGPYDAVAAHTIDLDVGLFHCDFNATALPDIRRRYGADVTVRVLHEEGLFTLETNRDDLSVADVVAEFRLESLADYLARNERLQDAWRNGESPPDLTPPYLGRRQWP